MKLELEKFWRWLCNNRSQAIAGFGLICIFATLFCYIWIEGARVTCEVAFSDRWPHAITVKYRNIGETPTNILNSRVGILLVPVPQGQTFTEAVERSSKIWSESRGKIIKSADTPPFERAEHSIILPNQDIYTEDFLIDDISNESENILGGRTILIVTGKYEYRRLDNPYTRLGYLYTGLGHNRYFVRQRELPVTALSCYYAVPGSGHSLEKLSFALCPVNNNQ